jgi:hypothetical protein
VSEGTPTRKKDLLEADADALFKQEPLGGGKHHVK